MKKKQNEVKDTAIKNKIAVDYPCLYSLEMAKYIIPPGLNDAFINFIHLNRLTETEPIMIVGETGVGKSMFLHIAQKLFEKKYGKGNKKHPVHRVNCAHFEPNLARSELFGHVKGAFTGAINDKKGCVELANNGLLILEEIGELPLKVQSMLLTFIETGEYKRVGEPKILFAKARIIGATNREGALRPDFRYRFLPFYVPPLHKRRSDALYYFFYMFPDLVQTFTMSEVLSLIAYHWPGNVREISRVAILMKLDKLKTEYAQLDSDNINKLQALRLHSLDNRYTFLDSSLAAKALQKVRTWGGDIKLLERMLNEKRVGLSGDNLKPAFGDMEVSKIILCYTQIEISDQDLGLENIVKELDVFPSYSFNEFSEAYEGFLRFCGLFGQDPKKNVNILDDLSSAETDFFDFDGFRFKGHSKNFESLLKAVMRSIAGFTVVDFRYPDDPYEYWQVLDEQRDQYDLETGIKHKESKGPDDIWSMKEDELRKVYYKGLLEKTGGNVRAAAKRAGLNETTLRARMDSLKILYKKDYKRTNN